MLYMPYYIGPGGHEYVQPTRYGWSSIPVLQHLWGRVLGELEFALIHALRPSRVRVVYDCEWTNSVPWRVTVHMNEDHTIHDVQQEVEVALPDGIQNGYELQCALDGVPAAQPDANGIYGFTNVPDRKMK